MGEIREPSLCSSGLSVTSRLSRRKACGVPSRMRGPFVVVWQRVREKDGERREVMKYSDERSVRSVESSDEERE